MFCSNLIRHPNSSALSSPPTRCMSWKWLVLRGMIQNSGSRRWRLCRSTVCWPFMPCRGTRVWVSHSGRWMRRQYRPTSSSSCRTKSERGILSLFWKVNTCCFKSLCNIWSMIPGLLCVFLIKLYVFFPLYFITLLLSWAHSSIASCILYLLLITCIYKQSLVGIMHGLDLRMFSHPKDKTHHRLKSLITFTQMINIIIL